MDLLAWVLADCQMQKLIRETGGSSMDADVHANFVDSHAKGKLLAPELSVHPTMLFEIY